MTMVTYYGQNRRLSTLMNVDESVKASEFKAKCLAMLDEVARTRREIVVTKHGRPIAKLVPLDAPPSLAGSVTYVDPADDLLSTDEVWDAD